MKQNTIRQLFKIQVYEYFLESAEYREISDFDTKTYTKQQSAPAPWSLVWRFFVSSLSPLLVLEVTVMGIKKIALGGDS